MTSIDDRVKGEYHFPRERIPKTMKGILYITRNHSKKNKHNKKSRRKQDAACYRSLWFLFTHYVSPFTHVW